MFEVVLVRFALERLLYRLSQSAHRDRFVLKGGMLVTVWLESESRETRDADFLGHGDEGPKQLVADFREIMSIAVEDGIEFDLDALKANPIREEMEYGGTRLKTFAYLERTRIPVTIDIGFGDALAHPSHELTYPPATVIAEKFQAMVQLGIANGRMKDYYDLWAMPQALDVSDDELDAAIAATFARRGTEIPIDRPPGLSEEMAQDGTKQGQWAAYAESIDLEKVSLEEVIETIWSMVGSACKRIAQSK